MLRFWADKGSSGQILKAAASPTACLTVGGRDKLLISLSFTFLTYTLGAYHKVHSRYTDQSRAEYYRNHQEANSQWHGGPVQA